MNRNDIRPAVIGVAAGAATIAGLIAWFEIEPHRAVVDYLARRQLTADERAEIDRIAARQVAEQEERADFYKEQDAKAIRRRTKLLAGFEPELLTASRTVGGPDELSLEELVAEIVHVEAQSRNLSGWILDPRAGDHVAALHAEWRRRDYGLNRYTRPRVEQLRYDLARDKVEAAARAPYSSIPPFTPKPFGEDIYPDSFGVDAAAADREVQS